ncbi:MAG: type II secretion system protein M [Clostridia bacterium]|nr:type II secretion system protein M [Clostridia bacterium]
MNTAKRDKIILSVLAIIIIGVIMFYATIKPSMDEIKKLNAQITDARDSIAGLKSKSQLINELKKQLEEIEAEVKANEGNMTSFDDYALYLSDFQDVTEGVASNTTILFTSVTSSETGHYVVVQADISFVCEYNELKNIMNAMLDNKAHCYNVRITEASTSDDTAESTLVKVTFTADYFSRNGAYVYTEYDFTSGRYGLTDLFDGVAIVTP